MAQKKTQSKSSSGFTVDELKSQLEEAEIRAQLSEARARNAEAVLRARKARLVASVLNEKNVLGTL